MYVMELLTVTCAKEDLEALWIGLADRRINANDSFSVVCLGVAKQGDTVMCDLIPAFTRGDPVMCDLIPAFTRGDPVMCDLIPAFTRGDPVMCDLIPAFTRGDTAVDGRISGKYRQGRVRSAVSELGG
ncbi:unnamed protein product [Arctogadus glacialis]